MGSSEQLNLVKDLKKLNAVQESEKQRISECLLDFLGSALLGTRLDIGKRVIQEYRNTPHHLAFILPYLAELTEYSHGHHREAGHVGSTTLPVALALASTENLEHVDYTYASMVGYEAVCRFGESIMPDLKIRLGANATGFTGTVGAAAVASEIYDFNVDEMNMAIGLAAYLTPFNPQAGYTTGAHGFETSIAVINGIKAVQLARMLSENQIDSTPHILDVYYKTIKGTEPFNAFNPPAKQSAAIYDLYFKPYPSCRATHGVIE